MKPCVGIISIWAVSRNLGKNRNIWYPAERLREEGGNNLRLEPTRGEELTASFRMHGTARPSPFHSTLWRVHMPALSVSVCSFRWPYSASTRLCCGISGVVDVDALDWIGWLACDYERRGKGRSAFGEYSLPRFASYRDPLTWG